MGKQGSGNLGTLSPTVFSIVSWPCLPLVFQIVSLFLSPALSHIVGLPLFPHFSPTCLPLVILFPCWMLRIKTAQAWTYMDATREPLKLGFAKAGLLVFPLLGHYLFAGRHATAIECQLHRLLWLCMRPSHSKKTQFDLDFAIFCSYFTILVASRRQPPAPEC